jgi:hypothetical protein
LTWPRSFTSTTPLSISDVVHLAIRDFGDGGAVRRYTHSVVLTFSNIYVHSISFPRYPGKNQEQFIPSAAGSEIGAAEAKTAKERMVAMTAVNFILAIVE